MAETFLRKKDLIQDREWTVGMINTLLKDYRLPDWHNGRFGKRLRYLYPISKVIEIEASKEFIECREKIKRKEIVAQIKKHPIKLFAPAADIDKLTDNWKQA